MNEAQTLKEPLVPCPTLLPLPARSVDLREKGFENQVFHLGPLPIAEACL